MGAYPKQDFLGSLTRCANQFFILRAISGPGVLTFGKFISNPIEALAKPRQLPVHQTEIIDNLSPWKEADEVDEGEA